MKPSTEGGEKKGACNRKGEAINDIGLKKERSVREHETVNGKHI